MQIFIKIKLDPNLKTRRRQDCYISWLYLEPLGIDVEVNTCRVDPRLYGVGFYTTVWLHLVGGDVHYITNTGPQQTHPGLIKQHRATHLNDVESVRLSMLQPSAKFKVRLHKHYLDQ